MCKALGIILTVLALGVFTYKKIELKNKELCNLEEMAKALNYIKHELSFSLPELAALCKKAAEQTEGDISHAFNSVYCALNKDKTIDFYSAWLMAVKKNKMFSDEAEKTILHFAKNFGRKTIETEIENIENTANRIKMLLLEKKENYKNDKKLICSLSAAVGAVIIILAI